MIQLDRTTYRDKVYACWLGKNIGGTLGAPYEGRQFVNDLTFYDPVPDESAPNDDLDLQLVWLKLLEDVGVDPPLPAFADYWLKYLGAYPWNEYGFCHRNLARGLRPPISGCFENYFVDEMGSPIRSEVWACVAPGNPQLAAAMAWKDSVLDHAGGQGMMGEMFLAAVESAAFVLSDPLTLIDIGLAMIPPASAIARVVRQAVWAWRNNVRWSKARDEIIQQFEVGRSRGCNAIVNHGFIILGWLYGKDFGDRLCRAANCGYDTDCTGASLGSILGLIDGTAGIPARWSDPIGTTIVLHKFTGDFNVPHDLDELTDRTVAVGERVTEARSDAVCFGDAAALPEDPLSMLFRTDLAREALSRDVLSAVAMDGDAEISLHYHGEPVLRPNVARSMGVLIVRNGVHIDAQPTLEAPDGWRVDRTENGEFLVTPPDFDTPVALTVSAGIDGDTRRASFTVLSPTQAVGFAAGLNVPTCRVCRGYAGSCLCEHPPEETAS